MITAPAGSPPWAAAFAQQIDKAIRDAGALNAPERVYAVDSPTDLTRLAPKDNVERVVFVRSIARLAVSTGTAWLRTDTGAQIAP